MENANWEGADRDGILDILRRCDVCRLALFDREYPYIVPLLFGARAEGEGLALYLHGAPTGKKMELIERNPKVCFEMDCSHKFVTNTGRRECSMEFESVVGYGAIEMIDGDEAKADALSVILGQYRSAGFEYNRKSIPTTAVMRLQVESCTARRKVYARAEGWEERTWDSV